MDRQWVANAGKAALRNFFTCLGLQAFQVQVGACTDARQRHEVQGSTQVTSVQSAQWQSYAIACQWCALFRESLCTLGLRCRCVHVGPNTVNMLKRDATCKIIN